MEELLDRFVKATSAADAMRAFLRESLEKLVSGVRKDAPAVARATSRARSQAGGCGCDADAAAAPLTAGGMTGGMPLPQHYFGGEEEAAFYRGGEGAGTPEPADGVGGWAPTVSATMAHPGLAMSGGSTTKRIVIPRKMALSAHERKTLDGAIQLLADRVSAVASARPAGRPPTAKAMTRALTPVVNRLLK